MKFRDLPLERKFLLAMLLVTLSALLVTCSFLIYSEWKTMRGLRAESASGMVGMIAANAATSLLYDDPEVALQILSGMRADPHLVVAALYGSNGALYAWFPTNFPTNQLPPGNTIPALRFVGDHLDARAEILSAERVVGSAFVRSHLRDLKLRFRIYVGSVAAVTAVAIVVVFLLAKLLQRWVTQPLLALSSTAQTIATGGDYSLRAKKESADEVGLLVDAFNRMLNEVQVSQARAEEELSERRRVEEALREAHAELDRRAQGLEAAVQDRTAKLRETIGDLEAFSYSIAHDMRAPLRSMSGYSSLLLSEYADKLDAEAQGFLRRIAASAERLDRLIQDVLDYSKIVRGELKLEPVNSGKLVREIIDSYPNLQPPNAEIIVEGTLPVVRANPAAFTQVISNLLGNAVKFVAEGVQPRVVVRAETTDTTARFWFEDNGIGIETIGRDRIFQMFQRLHHPDKYEGTGIGLTIVRKAVERMGGQVGVESELGRGSRFWVELQRA